MKRRTLFASLLGFLGLTGIHATGEPQKVEPVYTVESLPVYSGGVQHWRITTQSEMNRIYPVLLTIESCDPEVLKDFVFMLNRARAERLEKTT